METEFPTPPLSAPPFTVERHGSFGAAVMAENRWLRAKLKRQRRELRRLNRELASFWRGFSRGLSLEGEVRLRGIMNAAFGHERVHEAEMAAAAKRAASATPGS
jgi:hypothetical protein